jgi:hypothetical protein
MCSRSLAYHGSEPNVHLSIGQNMHERAADFVDALGASVRAASTKGFSQTAARAKAELSQMGVEGFKPEMLGALLKAAGVEDGQLPRTPAELNQILNVLPPAVTEYVLTQFMNERYIYREKK